MANIVDEKKREMANAIIEFIENHEATWKAGWSRASAMPVNGKTNKSYRGMNSLFLAIMAQLKGYEDPRWVTFNQAKELGASVKKGEKSCTVLFFDIYDKKTKKSFDARVLDGMTDEEIAQYKKDYVMYVAKYSQVFNAQQCENFPALVKYEAVMSEQERAEHSNVMLEKIIANSAAPIYYDGGSQAFYRPSTDSIHLPKIEDFHSMQDYYATATHEIAHSTGHPSRLNREFGSDRENYAREELRAELASVFMQQDLGIDIVGVHFENHAAYLKAWLAAVKRDYREFFNAVSDAEKISDYVIENYANGEKEPVEKKEQTTDESVARKEFPKDFESEFTEALLDEFEAPKTGNALYKKYTDLQAKYPGKIIALRIGDFYEILGADAELVSDKTGLTLTGRDCGLEKRVPMVGFPFHADDIYFEKIKALKGVVVVENNEERQIEKAGEPPKAEEKILTVDTVKAMTDEEVVDEILTDKIEVNKQDKITSRWSEINVPQESIGREYGKMTMVRLPKTSVYAGFVMFVPTSLISKKDDGSAILKVVKDALWLKAKSEGKEVELDADVLKKLFDGEAVEYKGQRVAVDEKNLRNIDRIVDNIPVELKSEKRWCVHKRFWKRGEKQPTKQIFNPNKIEEKEGSFAKVNDSSTWVDFETAERVARTSLRNCEGLTFVLGNGYSCIDLDHCFNDEDKLSPMATEILKVFKGTYVERSMSGKGLHIFVKGDLRSNGRFGNKNSEHGDIEVYEDSKFISLTGNLYGESREIATATPEHAKAVQKFLKERKSVASSIRQPFQSLTVTEEKVLERIRRSKVAVDFDSLMRGESLTGDASRDDFKLLNMLAFFSGGDKLIMESVFRKSGLFRANKEKYLQHSINRACETLVQRIGAQSTRAGRTNDNSNGK